MFRLAHISDLHLSRLPPIPWAQLANKRLLGYLSWRLNRQRQHRATLLAALVRDLHAVKPDHIAITGDLVNLALPAEFAEAAAWLQRLGPPESVSVVPGNHDALVPVLPGDGWDHWRAYTSSDPDTPDADDGFPYLRRRGPLALVGLSTAFPSLPGQATGRLGAVQLARLDRLLEHLSGAAQCRVLLMHHSPVAGVSRRRRRLLDAPELRRCLAERGADLVLHGHEHRFRFDQVPGASGPVPVFGAPSASKAPTDAGEVVQYYVYEIAGRPEQWRIIAECRRFASESEGFVQGMRQIVAPEGEVLALHPEPAGDACRRSA